MMGALWLPSVGTTAEFTVSPGRIVGRYATSRDLDVGDMEVALTSTAKAMHLIAEVTGPAVTGDTQCEARLIDLWDNPAAVIVEVCMYNRRAA